MYLNNKIKYNRIYGDFLIWKQILSHSKTNSIENVIFITNDNKEDWWHIHEGKTISPRVELIEEALNEAKIKIFHMYNLNNFIKHAKQSLAANISNQSIKEIEIINNIEFEKYEEKYLSNKNYIKIKNIFYKEFSDYKDKNFCFNYPDKFIYSNKYINNKSNSLNNILLNWIRKNYNFDSLETNMISFPNFILKNKEKIVLFQIFFSYNETEIYKIIKEILLITEEKLENKVKLCIIILEENININDIINRFAEFPDINLELLFGEINDNSGETQFYLTHRMNF